MSVPYPVESCEGSFKIYVDRIISKTNFIFRLQLLQLLIATKGIKSLKPSNACATAASRSSLQKQECTYSRLNGRQVVRAGTYHMPDMPPSNSGLAAERAAGHNHHPVPYNPQLPGHSKRELRVSAGGGVMQAVMEFAGDKARMSRCPI